MKTFKEYTDEERSEFTNLFYDRVNELLFDEGLELDDLDNSTPFGCPWYWTENTSVQNTVANTVKIFVLFIYPEIVRVLKEDLKIS